jgi:aryl-alcohol dehydrogenase-like predicted oxidoreductase/enamine deaminase RidA (YjgF/YER057c/UK114 family)
MNNNKLEVPKVVMGLWQIADMERDGVKVDKEEAAKAMMNYYENGFNTFDMADHYGSAEEISGYFKKKYAPENLKLFTKWVPQPGAIDSKKIEEAVRTAQQKLNTDCIQLLQFHAWNYSDPHWLDCLFGLDQLRQKGMIEKIGLTNFDEPHLNMVVKSGIQISSNQVCHSLLDQRAAGKMSATCLENNIGLLAFGTVAGGFFSEKWLNKPEPLLDGSLTWSQMKYKRYIDAAGGWAWFQELLQTLKSIADSHRVSIATVASASILYNTAVSAVIIGARLGKSEHIAENRNLFTVKLNAEEINSIKTILAKGITIPGDCGDEYRKPPFLTASGDLSHHFKEMPSPYPVIIENDGKSKALSGTPWESMAGYSRAVKKGNHIYVSGTTATHGNKLIGGSDPAAQTHFIIDKIEGAIQSLGGRLEDVVRTRIFVKDITQWESIARAHGNRFGTIQPANTMVQADLVGNEYLVEIEADAIVS